MATKKTKNPSLAAASVRIIDAADMTKKGRKAIADWLRSTADDLEELGDQYSGQFIARYWVPGRKAGT